MRQSKFIKLNKDILLEYIYDDQNFIGEDYKIISNLSTNPTSKSFASTSTSGTKNIQENQLVQIDPIQNKWGLVNSTLYNFIQVSDYAGGVPVRYDRIKIHTSINYTFSEFIGFQMRVYSYDYNNQTSYDLTNYFYDISDVARFGELGFSAPPLQFQEKLWGKNLEINIPSPYGISLQRTNGTAKPNSINYNLSGVGLSLTSPIFIEFSFIKTKQTINGLTSYFLDNPINLSIPIVPEFENLSVKIEESSDGDFFEIYGIFNGNIGEFKKFIDDSFFIGHRYYVEYIITTYEENIKQKTKTFRVLDNFNEKIEERPIIKFSTTTAVIDVEMRLIDLIDDSQIIRRASYGMLPDQISKYSLNLTKINTGGFSNVKIYNLKNVISAESLNGFARNSVQLQQVKIPYPVMVDKYNVVTKSDNVRIKKDIWYGLGQLKLFIMPFDNIISITIAQSIETDQVKLMDLNNSSEIKLTFQNEQLSVDCTLYNEHGEVDLSQGFLVFKIFKKQISDIRKVYNSTTNTFYITSTFDNNTTVIYSGLFEMFDSKSNVNVLNNTSDALNTGDNFASDPNSVQETAIVTRKQITTTTVTNPNGTNTNNTNP